MPLGYVDSFNAQLNVAATTTVTALTVQSDHSVLIGGTFTTVSGLSRLGIVRMTATGFLDATFTGVNLGASQVVYKMVEYTGNKILVAGNFFTI